MNPTPSYWQLFLAFFRIGVTAFGGPAMSAHIRKDIVDQRKWMDGRTFDAGLALCQVIPGAIVMQLAAYVGLKLKDVKGAVISFVAFGLPAFIIMLVLTILYARYRNVSEIEAILKSLRVMIIAIMANGAFSFGKRSFRSYRDVIIALIAGSLFLTKLHPALVVILSAFLGLALSEPDHTVYASTGKVARFRFFIALAVILFATLAVFYIFNIDYFNLATIMLRIDLFSFGGGLAAVPIMYHELVDLFQWFDKQTFFDGIILGQVTPGSIIIAATYEGYLHAGLMGSIIATICVFTPSFIILMAIVPFFDKLRKHPFFNKVINGILCSFTGLLVVVTYHFGIEIQWSLTKAIIVAAAFAALIYKVDVIWIILVGILISFLGLM